MAKYRRGRINDEMRGEVASILREVKDPRVKDAFVSITGADHRGVINDKGFDGKGNYTFGISEQIIFPEIDIDKIGRIQGMDITFVTTAKTDKEAMSLLKEFGLPFKNQK